jgi:TonB family protein
MSTMTTRSPSAFALSALLHGVAAVLVLGGAWLAQKNLPPPPQIFELVAGEGNDFMATVAPKGNPEGGGPIIPPLPKPLPPAARPDPDPAPSQPVQTPAPRRSTTPSPRQTTAPTPNQMTKEEFDRRNNTPRSNQPTRQSQSSTQPQRRGNGPRINTGDILGNTNTTSTRGAGGTALTRAESDERSAYLSYLVQQLKAAHEKPPGLSDLLRARVEFRINADGSITGVHIIESSGNTAFDQSAVAAFRQIRLSPPPGGRPITDSVLFRMKDER